ncbi:zinc metalloproteinase nas-4-like [Tubulanus polymorphus]|uniref:zinc metalloproteinase nas-4-like n=1 Tax=Tubulanus polymorphus TaxID=672921 RepID=UPI003DA39F54
MFGIFWILAVFRCIGAFKIPYEDPLYKDGYFEGDIVLDDYRTAHADKSKKWADNTFYYEFDESLAYSRKLVEATLVKFAERINSAGHCLTFKKVDPNQRKKPHNRALYYRGYGCSSNVGSNNGLQRVSIGRGCDTSGTIVHETMHALGFWHEQSRMDRDDYITIHWENMKTGSFGQFQKYGPDKIDHLGIPYDLDSVMHYNEYAYSMNGRKTIESKKPLKKWQFIGQRIAASELDLKRIRVLYGCDPRPAEAITTTTTLPPVSGPGFSWSCNFEDDWCGVTRSREDTLTWTRRKGVSDLKDGPDNPRESYAQVSLVNADKQVKLGRLYSPTIPADPRGYKIEFTGYATGQKSRIYITATGTEVSKVLRNDERTNAGWFSFNLPLERPASDFKLKFAVIAEEGAAGVFALFHVKVTALR